MRVVVISKQCRDYSDEFAKALGEYCDVTYYGWPGTHSRRNQIGSRVSAKPVHWPRHRSLMNLAVMADLLRRIATDDPDVVHILHEHNVWLSFLLPFLQRRWPIVVTVHDVQRHPGDWDTLLVPNWLRRLSVSAANAVIVHGKSQVRHAQDVFGIGPDRLHVLQHLALPRYRRIADMNKMVTPGDGLIRILFFGRIYEYKGLDYLIASSLLVHREDDRVRFTIAGSGKLSHAQRRAIASSSRITLINRHINEYDTARLFTEADIVVLPYVAATQSGVLAIASTFGKPVVVTDVGELPEVVCNNNMGVVVPPRDERALANAISGLVRDPRRRDIFGRASEVAARGGLSGVRVVADALRVYEAVVASRARENRPVLRSRRA